MPRRALLLLVRLVVLVEHDHRPQVCDRGPCRRPGAHDGGPDGADRPVVRVGGDCDPDRAEPGRHGRRHGRRRAQHEGVAERGCRTGHVDQVGGRRQAEHRARTVEGGAQELVLGRGPTRRLAHRGKVPDHPVW